MRSYAMPDTNIIFPLFPYSGLTVSGGVHTAILTSTYPKRTMTTSWLSAFRGKLRRCCSSVKYPGMAICSSFPILSAGWNYSFPSRSFHLQHHLSVFWRGDSKPGSPLNHRCDPRDSGQTSESLGSGWSHARGQPDSCREVKAGGLLSCWGQPFFHWCAGKYNPRIPCHRL